MAKKKPVDHGPGAIDNGVRVDISTLALELRQRTDERDAIASERGRISNQLKIADEAVANAVAAIVAASRPAQTVLFSADVVDDRGEADTDENDEPDEALYAEQPEDERPEREIVAFSGSTGAPIASDGEYLMEPSPEDPNVCTCGWEIASPIPGHDRRHEQYLRSIEDESAGHAPPVKKRGSRDMTAAVAKRSTAAKKSPPSGRKKAVRR